MAPTVYGGRWQNTGPLGGGGQADTFKVIDLQGDRKTTFALKLLRNTRDPERQARFRAEVEAIQRLSHPNVIALVAADLDAERPYMVSEYCQGGSLEGTWSQATRTREHVLELFIQVCDGLSTAHQQGIVHRDIKPANILLRGATGPAVVADFGLVYVDDGVRYTLTHEQVGSRFYMAPELANGRADQVTTRSDVYSLGKLLYWMLTDRIFDRERHREPDRDLVEVLGDASYEHVNRLLLDHTIREEPQDRYPDAAVVGKAALEIERLWSGGFNVVSPSLPQRCLYCGLGYYRYDSQLLARDSMGLPPYSGDKWRILYCPECGHVQHFRMDLAKRREEWWGEQPR